eukprot:ANDGO_06518.mRNA.1 Protein RIK
MADEQQLEHVFVIDDLPSRHLLTRSNWQKEAEQRSGASIVTKGTFRGSPPLHLLITADTPQKLEMALSEVQAVTDSRRKWTGVTEKVFVSEKHPDFEYPHPGFRLPAKLLGPQGEFIKFVARETNTRVLLKGRGTGASDHHHHRHHHHNSSYQHEDEDEEDELLHFHISAVNESSVKDACVLVRDLISHVEKQYAEFRERGKKIQAERASANVSADDQPQQAPVSEPSFPASPLPATPHPSAAPSAAPSPSPSPAPAPPPPPPPPPAAVVLSTPVASSPSSVSAIGSSSFTVPPPPLPLFAPPHFNPSGSSIMMPPHPHLQPHPHPPPPPIPFPYFNAPSFAIPPPPPPSTPMSEIPKPLSAIPPPPMFIPSITLPAIPPPPPPMSIPPPPAVRTAAPLKRDTEAGESDGPDSKRTKLS